MNDERHYLSTCEAAEYLGLSARTLRRYRVTGEGPVFHRFGARVRYRRGDLDEWAAVRRRTSTVDDGSVLSTARGPVAPARGSRAGRARERSEAPGSGKRVPVSEPGGQAGAGEPGAAR